jgi:hypothetical protein
MQAPQPSLRPERLPSAIASYFGVLWRRSPALTGVLVLASGLLPLLVVALLLQPSGDPRGATESQTTALSRPSARAGADPDAATLMGKTLTGRVVAQDKSVPLPPGQWIVVAHLLAPNPGGVESLFLAQPRRDKLSRTVLVQASAPADESARGYRRSAGCARGASLYVKTLSNEELGRQDCWSIDHNPSTQSERETPPIIRAAIGELARRGVKYPPVLISASFRLADRQSFLHAVYSFNPEIDGIASKPAPWDESDWHRNAIHRYPEKIAYVEKLRAWAEAWHPAVRDAFEGIPPAQAVRAGTAAR